MRLTDFFNVKDLVRTALLGSALLLLFGSVYGVFLHAMYAGQVTQVKHDLISISGMLSDKASTAYAEKEGELSRGYKETSKVADEYSKQIEAPPVTPSAYTYFNYWIASAAFTKLHLTPEILGLPNKTIDVMYSLKNDEILGEAGWYAHPEFKGFSKQAGEFVQYLPAEPELETHFWSFYIFVFIVSTITIWFGVKEQYELPVIPEIIYGGLMPVLFFVVFSFTAMLSRFEILPFLDPSQVDFLAYLLAFTIMLVISATASLCAGLLRMKFKRRH